MNRDKSGIARRDFLRVIGITGLGLGFNLQQRLAEGTPPDSFTAKAKGAIIVGLDIGSSKVCVAVGERQSDDAIKILGVGQAPSRGVRKGEIFDLGAASKCVHNALVDAEVKTDVMIRSVYVGITGPHISTFNNRGSVTIAEEQEGVEEKDFEQVRTNAREVSIPVNNAFIHSVLRHYYLDGRDVLNPIGMTGRKLEADFHIVRGWLWPAKNTIRCVREIPIEIEDLVFNPLAAAQAVLTQDQKNLGALVIDIGGGTTDYIVYADGAVTNSGCLTFGGHHITNDLSMGLRIPAPRAEKLKIEEGSVTVGQSMEIECEEINTFIRCHMRETFESMKERLETDGARFDLLGAGIQLTGGCSMLRGIGELAQEVFGLPAQLACVKGISGSRSILENPLYSCAIGLVKYGTRVADAQGLRIPCKKTTC